MVSSTNAPYMYIHVILVCGGRLVLQIGFEIHEKICIITSCINVLVSVNLPSEV